MPNDYVRALQTLRGFYVDARRARVADCVRNDPFAGNQKRLVDIQSAVEAVDAAIRDEESLALSAENGWAAISGLDRLALANGFPAKALLSGRESDQVREQEIHASSVAGRGQAGTEEQAWSSYEAWRSGRKAAANGRRSG